MMHSQLPLKYEKKHREEIRAGNRTLLYSHAKGNIFENKEEVEKNYSKLIIILSKFWFH